MHVNDYVTGAISDMKAHVGMDLLDFVWVQSRTKQLVSQVLICVRLYLHRPKHHRLLDLQVSLLAHHAALGIHSLKFVTDLLQQTVMFRL